MVGAYEKIWPGQPSGRDPIGRGPNEKSLFKILAIKDWKWQKVNK